MEGVQEEEIEDSVRNTGCTEGRAPSAFTLRRAQQVATSISSKLTRYCNELVTELT